MKTQKGWYLVKMTGKVKNFFSGKGYGFITTSEGKDVFFHYSEIKMEGYKTVDEGAEVEFDVVESDRGPRAQNIRIISAGTPAAK